jgi:transposase
MGRKTKVIMLTEEEAAALEQGYKGKGSFVFSQRCQMILLKSQGRSSKEIAGILRTNLLSVNQWVQRYEKQGIAGLQTKEGQGRKPILDKEADQALVKAAVQKERQRLKLAKADLEASLNKEFSVRTLKRFLKNLSADGSESV